MKIIEQSVRIIYPRTLAEGVQELKRIETAGRNCWRSEGKITPTSYRAFVDGLLKRGHESPIEFGHISFDIVTSRDVLAEITRHRLASFCVSGETKVGYDQRNKGCTIKELYAKTAQYKHMTKLRSIDETSKEIIMNNVVDVFYNGQQPTYEIKTTDGYSIRATASHEFFSSSGWKKLCDLHIGETIYTNGTLAYKQKDWLNQKYNIENLSQQEIAAICGISHHTVRSWIRKFGLQKAMGTWCIGKDPVNKGKNKDNYYPLQKTSQKMISKWHDPDTAEHMGRKRLPADVYYGELNSNGNGYTKVSNYYERKYVCAMCGEKCEHTEIHHIDKNPKNFTPDNLIELCMLCHKRMHKGDAVKAVKPSTIESITYYGVEDVYDIEMLTPYHNYIANGFVVHNCVESQRYVDESSSGDIAFIRPLFYKDEPDDPNHAYEDKQFAASMIWRDQMENIEQSYKSMRMLGIRNEDARKVLPNSTATRIMMDVNFRELLHIYKLRSASSAYPEMRKCMDLLKIEVDKVLPGFLPSKGDS